MTWVPNQWYVAAWDCEVDRTPLARTICGEPVLLYRRLDRSPVGADTGTSQEVAAE